MILLRSVVAIRFRNAIHKSMRISRRKKGKRADSGSISLSFMVENVVLKCFNIALSSCES